MQLPITKLETHETGTAGLNAIINGNWERLEEIFDPALSSSDPAYGFFAAALTRTGLVSYSKGDGIIWNGSRFKRQPGFVLLPYAASVNLDFDDGAGPRMIAIPIAGNLTLTTSNIAAGAETTVIILGDGTTRNLTFPGGWAWLDSAAPTSLAANKAGRLKLISTGSTDADILAQWAAEV